MLNLLFISDNPKAKYIKSALQPFLKVIIDVVTDFDHGLKEVFEKRPTTVCIQDQIGGVTGESVARHIQMLLGNSAPTFILLHNGEGKAKAVKGLYEHLIDLSQPDEVVTESIKKTLKLLLGDQWERIYIPSELAPDPVAISVVAPEESRENILTTVESDRAQTINDDLAELLLLERERAGQDKAAPAAAETKLVKTQPAAPAASIPGEKAAKSIPEPVTTPPTPPAAEFRINQNTHLDDDEDIPEDILLGFEESCRSESMVFRRTVAIGLVCVFLAAGGWYFFKHKPQLIGSLKQRLVGPSEPKQALIATSAPVPLQKPVPPPVQQSLKIPPLPYFIPKNGHDSTYALKNPGWERYVGERNEFRVFSASGHIKALQVLAVKDANISDSLLKSVLQEIAGNPKYKITSRSTKAGVLVENGRVGEKGDVLIYRRSGVVKAFVVSIE